MATIKDIARLANVNIATVSRAFNRKEMVAPEAYNRIMKIAKELGYNPNPLAQGLKGKKMKMVGVLVPEIDHSIFAGIIKGIGNTARRKGYSVIVCNTGDDPEEEKRFVEKLTNKIVDGIICSAALPDSPYWEDLSNSGIPLVLAVRQGTKKVDSVAADYIRTCYDATSILLSRGCKSVYFINGPLTVKPYAQRNVGFVKAMSEKGFNDAELRAFNLKDSTYSYSLECVESLIAQGKAFDGLVIASDAQTMAALRCLKQHGLRVPEDVKIIDCGGHGIVGMLETAVSVVEVPGEKIGEASMERVIELIESKDKLDPKTILVESELILREST